MVVGLVVSVGNVLDLLPCRKREPRRARCDLREEVVGRLFVYLLKNIFDKLFLQLRAKAVYSVEPSGCKHQSTVCEPRQLAARWRRR